MICRIRSTGTGPMWARCRRLEEASALTHFLIALAAVLLLRELL